MLVLVLVLVLVPGCCDGKSTVVTATGMGRGNGRRRGDCCNGDDDDDGGKMRRRMRRKRKRGRLALREDIVKSKGSPVSSQFPVTSRQFVRRREG